jgi:hypothetical protein
VTVNEEDDTAQLDPKEKVRLNVNATPVSTTLAIFDE